MPEATTAALDMPGVRYRPADPSIAGVDLVAGDTARRGDACSAAGPGRAAQDQRLTSRRAMS